MMMMMLVNIIRRLRVLLLFLVVASSVASTTIVKATSSSTTTTSGSDSGNSSKIGNPYIFLRGQEQEQRKIPEQREQPHDDNEEEEQQQQQQQQQQRDRYRALATAYNNYNNNNYDTNTMTMTMDSVMDSAKEYTTTIQVRSQNIVTTQPTEWTSQQLLIVVVTCATCWTLLLVCCCCCRRCRRRRRDKIAIAEATSHTMCRPYVKRVGNGTGAVLSSITSFDCIDSPLSYGNQFDATDINRLPLGVRLHGGIALRRRRSEADTYAVVVKEVLHETFSNGEGEEGMCTSGGSNAGLADIVTGLQGQNVRIAVIDSGIDASHPGFHGCVNSETKQWYRYGTSLDNDDHGTHVAGTIHFLAPHAELHDYRVFGQDGDMEGDAAVARSIRHAVDVTKCHIINMSLSVSYPVHEDVQKSIQYAYKKGVHMVCAAGNDGDGNPTTNEIYCYPAMMKETISVAAVRKEDGFFLQAASFSESNASVDYSGIGTNVVSLKPNTANNTGSGGVQTMSGTSMAAPHITGLIACLISNQPHKYNSNTKIRKLLNQHLIDIGEEAGYDKQTGQGFVTYLANSGNEDDKCELFDLLSTVAH